MHPIICPICQATLATDEAIVLEANTLSPSLPPVLQHVKAVRLEAQAGSPDYRITYTAEPWCGARIDVI